MATITTKFNVGDKVFTIDQKTMKIREFIVFMVCAFIHSDGKLSAKYVGKEDEINTTSYDEDVCFATKQELQAYIEQPVEKK